MDGFFEVIKSTGKSVYDFFLFMFVMALFFFVAAITAPVPAYHEVGIAIISFICLMVLCSGRPITGISIILIFGAMLNNGYFGVQ